MYFKVSKKAFLNSLNIVSRAIKSFSPLPAFSGVLIEVTSNSLILTGSDSDVSIRTKIFHTEDQPLIIQDMGSIVLEAKYILEIVRKLDSEMIELEIVDGFNTRIAGSSTEFNLNGIPASEYPAIDFHAPSQDFLINKETLRTMIGQTSFATTTQETKPVLMGVNFKCENGILTTTATDSYRLAKSSIALENANFNITIPSKTLNEITKVLEGEGDVRVCVDDKKAQFVVDETIIQTRLIDGLYPDTNRLIPSRFDHELVIDAKELLNSIDRASFIKTDGKSIIRLNLSTQECVMKSRSAEVGSFSDILHSASFSGENLLLSCNGRYVSEAIKALNCDMIRFQFCGDMRPFTITSTTSDECLQLVLPVRTY